MGMKQQTFSDIEYSNRRKKTRREEFLESMDEMIPWEHWVDIIRPYYPSGKRGRPPKNIEAMLRMYLMQNWFNFSDAGIEDAIYDSYAMRSFMHLDFFTEQVPDATTLLHFCHLVEENKIGEKIFSDVKSRLEKAGLMMHGGTIVDATIIAQRPKLGPHIAAMRQNIAEDLGVSAEQVNVKATTEEHLGFTGAEEGISAHAVCLIGRAE